MFFCFHLKFIFFLIKIILDLSEVTNFHKKGSNQANPVFHKLDDIGNIGIRGFTT